MVIFLCGDVMTGRGIDQILPHPSPALLYEPYVRDAREYIRLAEIVNGPIPKPVDFSYVWGAALGEFQRVAPDVKIINLETAVTRSNDYWRGKGINYRMNPLNLPCLLSARIDCCALANNHILDWGYSGLAETLNTLGAGTIKYAGAGRNLEEAWRPAALKAGDKQRVIVFSFGSETSGIPVDWAASHHRPGLNLLPNLEEETVLQIKERVEKVKTPEDIVVASIHWGSNWGYQVPQEERQFAHQLIETAGIDLVHGHSSHHVKGLEVHRGKLILYGCGDFLTDYEGIVGFEEYRPDLSLMYFARLNAATGTLAALEMVPTQVRQFRIHKPSASDAVWLQNTVDRESQRFKTRVELNPHRNLTLVS